MALFSQGHAAIHERLLAIDPERIWRSVSESEAPELQAQAAFSYFLRQVLDAYTGVVSSTCEGWAAVAGLEPMVLAPIAWTSGLHRQDLEVISKHDAVALERAGRVHVLGSGERALLPLGLRRRECLVISLVGFGELYGALFLLAEERSNFTEFDVEIIRQSEGILNRLCADENFSMRLSHVAAPLSVAGAELSRQVLGEVIARHAFLAFAADGVSIRFHVGQGGLESEFGSSFGTVPDLLYSPDSPDGVIASSLFDANLPLAVLSRHLDGSTESIGLEQSGKQISSLEDAGVKSLAVVRLTSDLLETPRRDVGSLTLLHSVPKVFSRRDISLLLAFCDRIADDLALVDQREENEAIARILRVQNQLGNRAEITALLGHDFGHKVLDVGIAIDEFVDACRKSLPEKKLPDRLLLREQKLKTSTEELKSIVQQLRQLSQGSEDPESTFPMLDEIVDREHMKGVFSEVKDTIGAALDRYGLDSDFRAEGDCRLFGRRSIFVQVLYNLLLNSIDAHRESGSRRHNKVHVFCREIQQREKARVVEFRVWDDGPGISRVHFQNADEIFNVGSSSKKSGMGTGTGLPVARSLLSKYFNADLTLVDRSKALFSFTVIVPREMDKR